MEQIKVSKLGCPHEPGWLDVRVDRATVLGNPFMMKHGEADREKVVEAYRRWLWANIKLAREGRNEIISITQYALKHNLKIAGKFKSPSSQQIVAELKRLYQLLKQGRNLRLLCHCKQSGEEILCHADVIKACLEWKLEQLHLRSES